MRLRGALKLWCWEGVDDRDWGSGLVLVPFSSPSLAPTSHFPRTVTGATLSSSSYSNSLPLILALALVLVLSSHLPPFPTTPNTPNTNTCPSPPSALELGGRWTL
ncbi:unnamed protein product [Cyclocybe aegerita]|uniref:Uncharacterized protein n=1 Tax=Cyclocybe aegerita TaxID=1973307 RepID=A0A8S0WBE0_CYCAE|nr:unnamed protein product [Cyclocybe aegerita]